MPILDNETGESLEYSQFCRHPKYKELCNTPYSNGLRRLCQGDASGTSGEKKQHVKGTYTFRVIKFENISHDRRKEICHTSVICEVRPNKEEPNCTCITVKVNRVRYPGYVATPIGSLELLKLIINSTISCTGASFDCFDIKNFYLDTPMDRSEYSRIKLSVITQEIIDEYNLLDYEHNRLIYFEIVRGYYGLPQSGRLANDMLCKRLNKEGFLKHQQRQRSGATNGDPYNLCL